MALLILFLFAAALLEVGGDAAVRSGLLATPIRWLPIVLGGALLAAYGVVVNLAAKANAKLDLGMLLGFYVGFFALVATFWNFRDVPRYPLARWLGLGLIIAGGVIIQRYGAAPPAERAMR
jgi:hypothetical protein